MALLLIALPSSPLILQLAGRAVKTETPDISPPPTVDQYQPTFLARMTGKALALLARIFSGATVRWIDCQPEPCQRVYFANHSSHLDALVLWAALPPELRVMTRPVAASDYWQKGPIRRYLAREVFNVVLIDRVKIKVHQSPVDLMIEGLGDKYSLIMFPEGGRGTGGDMGEFKSGIYYLSKKRPDLELVPVYMDNLNRVLPRGEYLPVPMLCYLTFGPPIWLESGEPKEQFLRRARQAVLHLKEI